MLRTLSVAEVKAQFAECLRETERGDSVVITKHGKRVAALIPASELAQFERLRAAAPAAGLAGLAGGWEGSEKLVETVFRAARTKTRNSPSLD